MSYDKLSKAGIANDITMVLAKDINNGKEVGWNCPFCQLPNIFHTANFDVYQNGDDFYNDCDNCTSHYVVHFSTRSEFPKLFDYPEHKKQLRLRSKEKKDDLTIREAVNELKNVIDFHSTVQRTPEGDGMVNTATMVDILNTNMHDGITELLYAVNSQNRTLERIADGIYSLERAIRGSVLPVGRRLDFE